MADRDKYGNYVNDKGVIIKVNTDRKGKDHVSFYGSDVDKQHDGVHVNIDYDKKSWNSTTHNADKSDNEKSSGGCYLTSACRNTFKKTMIIVKNLILRNLEIVCIKRHINHYYKTVQCRSN